MSLPSGISIKREKRSNRENPWKNRIGQTEAKETRIVSRSTPFPRVHAGCLPRQTFDPRLGCFPFRRIDEWQRNSPRNNTYFPVQADSTRRARSRVKETEGVEAEQPMNFCFKSKSRQVAGVASFRRSKERFQRSRWGGEGFK